MNEDDCRTFEYVTIPKANLDEIIVPHKELYAMITEGYDFGVYIPAIIPAI